MVILTKFVLFVEIDVNMMGMNYGNNWRMNQPMINQDQQSCFTGYNLFSGQSNFYMESNQQVDQWQPQQYPQNMQVQDFSQINNTLLYQDYEQPVEFTTTLRRKGQAKISETVKRKRQLRRNERERERQARLNNAFDVLRGSIPSFLAPYKEEQKLTQIETLRLAKYYIRSLKGMLEEYEEDKEDDDSADVDNEKKEKKHRSDSFSGSDAGSC